MKRIIFFMIIFLNLIHIGIGQKKFVTVNGKDIIDTTGQVLLLRGIGLGGWLVPEGYMLHTPGFGSPTIIHQQFADVAGQANADAFWQEYEKNYVRDVDIQKIAEWGFNSIRLPFHYNKFYDIQSGQFLDYGFQIVDNMIAWCKKYGLYLILDMHCAPGGQNKDNISDADGIEARLWTDRNNQIHTLKIWKEIARRYKDENIIIGYDLINEPVLPDGMSSQVLMDFYKEITDTIRTVDTNHLLFIEGNWYATSFDNLTPPYDPKWVYSFHKYWNATDQGTIQYLLSLRNQHNVPLWLGETGENSNTWFYQVKELMEQNGIGWCWWTHKKIETTTSPLSAKINPNYQKILDYLGGSGPKPSITEARNGLMQLAEDLKLENCEFRPGVVASLFDPKFNSENVPLKTHTIPGIINAVDYDLGNIGISYSDKDYINTSGRPNNPWNFGGKYRNDGVDIEVCQDSQGNGYNVGWIDVGEWLEYTVDVSESAYYQITLRFASNTSGGRVLLYLDQNVIADVNLPGTGGWQNWQDFTTDSILLPAGTHVLRVFTPTGGFNLNTFTFKFVASAIENDGQSLLKSFHIRKIYPNPFNSQAKIEFYQPENGDVELDISNSLGQKIEHIVFKNSLLGFHTYHWNANAHSSGIYFIQLRQGNRVFDIKKCILAR